VIELVAPERCSACGAAGPGGGGPLCGICDARLPRLDHDLRVPGLAACVAAVEFAGEVESWVHRFKYPARGIEGLDPEPAAVIRALAREASHRAPGTAPSWVIPVPLHPIPLRRRGFNPAALIAREVARARGLPLATRALARLRDTPSQTGLDRRQRERNLAGAFACRLRVPQRVWLVDDVITTGSTLAAAARALRGAGAREITGLCIAWTPRMR
jgi:ComF family protein